jgi:hypothetical protein
MDTFQPRVDISAFPDVPKGMSKSELKTTIRHLVFPNFDANQYRNGL